MLPTRVGIIGLSPGTWSASSHLRYLQTPDAKFRIVAVCNSSVESSQKAVKELKLGEGTKAYGNVQDIANDKDIDLVVVTVRVDRHYDAVLPSIKAGKNIFVEWPLAKNLQQAQELLQLSKDYNVKLAVVGLQGRYDSTVLTLKALLAEGRIGKVLSSTLISQGLIGGPAITEYYSYLFDRQIGGNLLTIPFSHLMDCVRETLGDFSSFQSLLSNQQKTIKILNNDGSVVNEAAKKTTHDQIMVQGTLESGAVMSVSVRGGPPLKGTPGVEWSIYGEKGEIRIKGPNANMQMNSSDSIELNDFETDKVEKIEFIKGTFDEMDSVLRNVARLYEAIAAGDKSVCDFEGAVKRHEFIEELYKQNPGT